MTLSEELRTVGDMLDYGHWVDQRLIVELMHKAAGEIERAWAGKDAEEVTDDT